MYEKIEKAASFIKEKFHATPEIGLILGSGLGVLADEIENAVKIPYSEIPEFPVSTVEGHAGQLVLGELSEEKRSSLCRDASITTRDILWNWLRSLFVL